MLTVSACKPKSRNERLRSKKYNKHRIRFNTKLQPLTPPLISTSSHPTILHTYISRTRLNEIFPRRFPCITLRGTRGERSAVRDSH